MICNHEYYLITLEPDLTGYVPFEAYQCQLCNIIIHLNDGDSIVHPAKIIQNRDKIQNK